ncbi:MAG: tetratricopeptide repeat protein, partial [Chloroflexota bacterium]
RDSTGPDDRPAFDDLITALRPPEPEPDPDEYLYARTASAALVDIPEIDLELPDVPLVGRDAIKSDLLALLNDSKHVLVYGFSGSGKTALASTVALEWMTAGNGEVLFIKAGAAEPDALLEAVGRAFDAGKAVAAERDDTGKMRVIAKLLRGADISLIVVDDAWNGPALLPLLRAATRRAVLVTARKHIPITGAHRPIPEMDAHDAVDLLDAHTGRAIASEHLADARTLCEKLGNHPFALRVLGKNMAVHKRTPAQMLDRLAEVPKMTVPHEFTEQGRESLAVLIEQSLDDLEPETRQVFLNMGAFFAPTITAEMMALYMSMDDSVRATGIKDADTQLRELAANGLLTVVPGTDEIAEHYRTHDMAHLYAQTQASDDDHRRAVRAAIAYTYNYNAPSLANFKALLPELRNFSGASAWAHGQGMWPETEDFAWNLYRGSEVLDLRGLYTQALALLGRAAAAAAQGGTRRDEGAHTGNLGNAYRDLGRYEEAIAQHEAALAIAREIGDRRGEGNQTGNLGIAYYNLGRYEEAIAQHEAALAISREIGDRSGEGANLGNLGVAYADLGRYEKAIAQVEAALAVAREIGDRSGEGYHLNNLGVLYELNLEDYDRAITCYEASLAIRRALGVPHLIEKTERNLAIAQAKRDGTWVAPEDASDD